MSSFQRKTVKVFLCSIVFLSGVTMGSNPKETIPADDFLTINDVDYSCPEPFANPPDFYVLDLNDQNPNSILRFMDEIDFQLLWQTAASEAARFMMIQNTVGCLMSSQNTKFIEKINGEYRKYKNAYDVARRFALLYREQRMDDILPVFSIDEKPLEELRPNDFIVTPRRLEKVIATPLLPSDIRKYTENILVGTKETLRNSMALQYYINAGNDYFKQKFAAEFLVEEVKSIQGRFLFVGEDGGLHPLGYPDEILCAAFHMLHLASRKYIDIQETDVRNIKKRWSENNLT